MSCVGGMEGAGAQVVGEARPRASHTTTGMPWLASASAHISPVGPAPAITTGGRCGMRRIL